MRRARAFLIVAVWLGTASMRAATAHADTQACIDAHVAVQEKRLAGDLRGARAASDVCAAEGCPAALRGECGRWRDDIDTELPTLKLAVVGAPPAATVELRIDGEEAALGGAIGLNPGHHSVEVKAGTKSARRAVHLVQGQRAELAIDLSAPGDSGAPPPPTREKALPVGPIVVGAIGVAGLGVFAVMGGLGASEFAELEETCAPRCRKEETDAVDTKLLVADVALGVGSAAVLAGVIWLIVDLTGDDGSPVAMGASGLSIAF